MNKFFGAALLFILPLALFSQYQYQRLNNMRELRMSEPLYQVESDYHTSIKPWDLWQMDSITDELDWHRELERDVDSWLGRKLFNERLVTVKGRNYFLTFDPIVNLRLATGLTEGEEQLYYVNTRGFNIEGQLGEMVTFSTSYLENQARFPDYITQFPRVIPGQGRSRGYGEGGFDFGVPSGEVSFTPNDIFSFTLGQGRNFYGEGYRSMLLSDAAFNYPFFRVETSFWRIKYVNLWAQHYDLRPQAAVIEAYPKKFLSSHYLSVNVTNRLNLSFFEAIVVGDTLQQHGVDVAFFNPIIFYRPVEFAVGSEQGNALMGLNASYKVMDGLQVYGQFLLDEFRLADITAGNGSWRNKAGWQIGAKYYGAFGVDGLFTRIEYNAARPYTYSHRVELTNYAHYSQPLAHPWGANFHEFIGQAVWQHKRWEVEGRLHLGRIGLDTTNGTSYGADVYKTYNLRGSEYGNEIGQGADGDFFFLSLRGAWLVNPATGLKLEAGIRWRELLAPTERRTKPLNLGTSQYVFFGLRTEFFNRYYDF